MKLLVMLVLCSLVIVGTGCSGNSQSDSDKGEAEEVRNYKTMYFSCTASTSIESWLTIRLSGDSIGTISKLSLEDDGSVLIEARVKKDVSIPADSKICIDRINVFGTKELWITPGASTDYLTSSDTTEFDCTEIDITGTNKNKETSTSWVIIQIDSADANSGSTINLDSMVYKSQIESESPEEHARLFGKHDSID